MNLSNKADYHDYSIAYNVHHLKVFRTTTYFKRFYFGFTKQKRRKAAWKKRLSFLVPHLNVVGLWAKEYRFFRHESRFNYTSNLFLVNYLVNNNVTYANIQTLQSLKYDSFITASSTNRLYNYYSKKQLSVFFMTKYTKSALAHILSTYDPQTVTSLGERDYAIAPLTYFYQNHMYGLDTNLHDNNTILLLFQRLFESLVTQSLLVYKILILTFLTTLKF